ncbi:MAG: hypothetical protein ACLUAM_04225 [Bifidobacterium adolescentis]
MTKRRTAPPDIMQMQASKPIIAYVVPGSMEPETGPSTSTATAIAADSKAVANPANTATHIIRDTRSTKGNTNDTAASSTINASMETATYRHAPTVGADARPPAATDRTDSRRPVLPSLRGGGQHDVLPNS